MYKNEEKLRPTAYVPSQMEIELAKARYTMDNKVWEIVHYLIQYYDMTKGKEPTFPYTKENIEEYAKKSIDKWNKSMEQWDDDNFWDAFVNKEWFEAYYINGLSDIHSGDCTAFASTCFRCSSENIFRIPNTANWSKCEGAKMWAEYTKDIENKKLN